MNEPQQQSDFAGLMGLVEAATSAKEVFPYITANARQLRLEVKCFLEYVRTNETLFYERLLATALAECLDSGVRLENLEQAKSYASSLVLHDGKTPWLVSMLQSIWHLRNDPAEAPRMPSQFSDKVAVLVSLYNETRFCELALRSIRVYAGIPHYLVIINNSTCDVSGFRQMVARDGLADAWLDTGVKHHGLGLQKAFAHISPFRYVATFDSDAVGLKAGWLRDLVDKLTAADAALIGPLRDARANSITGAAIHPCCMVIDRKRIGSTFQPDLRSQWPFWDVGGLLTWDCNIHSLPIVTVSHKNIDNSALFSSLVNDSVRHYWYASRIVGLEDGEILDDHKVGDIRARLDKEYNDSSLDELKNAWTPNPPQARHRPLLSVVLTTCNRQDLLRTVLEGFAAQSAPKEQWELVVVDDGSQPPAKELVESFADRIDARYLYQTNSGLAAARNAGIRAAAGKIIFFHDDDDLPDMDVVAEHIRSHIEHPEENIAVLGHWDWHPDLKVTPLMHYITHRGGQYFGYDGMTHGIFYEPWKWWGGQISAKASLLRSIDGPFDERFTYGHEDTELVCRLLDRGISILYNSNAKKFVLRNMTLEDFCKRRTRQGRALFHLAAKHPQVATRRYRLESAREEYEQQFRHDLADLYNTALSHEPRLNANPQPYVAGTDPAVPEIHRIWQRCFRGYQLKGYLEEASAAVAGRSAMMLPVNLGVAGIETQEAAPASQEVMPVQGREPELLPELAGTSILVICPALPRPDIGSSNVRVHGILRLLVEQGHQVRLVYFGETSEDKRYTESWEGRINIEHLAPRTSDLISYIQSASPPDCVWITNLWNPAFCESMYKVAGQLRQLAPDIRLVIDTMDHHARKYQRQFQHSRNEKDLAISGQFASIEAQLYPLADRVITVTQAEKMSIEASVPGCSCKIIPNIHVPSGDVPSFQHRDNICFIGSLQIRHNTDAIKWFIHEILPAIRQCRPSTELHIMGYGTDQYRTSLEEYRGVRVVGYVQDAEAAVSQYRAFVCPLLYGAGLKGKLGTAASAGTPFVTTSVGAEGFDLTSGKEGFVADTPAEFADRCLILLDDEAMWNKISGNARRHFEALFSPRAVGPMLAAVMKDIMSQPPKASFPGIPAGVSPDRVAALLEQGKLGSSHRQPA